ncbi:MAG: hypothetical protein JW768_00975 [Chitinispirillaceae bacterium]|nr:hypothetical protein [Chitinispirillaceae bacterium]
MRKSLFFLRVARLCTLCVFLSVPPAHSGTDAPSGKERLRLVKEQIDSLEVEKQASKRQGLPIADLEHTTTELRDSVAQLREEVLENRNSFAAGPDLSGSLQKMIPAAVNLIDILLITAAALIATVFVLVYFLSAAKRRRKKSAGRPEVKRYEGIQERERRIEQAQKAYVAQTNKPVDHGKMPEPPLPNAPLPARPPDHATNGPDNLNNLVIQADRDGMDIKTISERYHVGVDQVALILKMAKKK